MSALSVVAAEKVDAGKLVQSSFRVRSDPGAELNADAGWAGKLSENVSISADQPFRLRFEVENREPVADGRFRLQYRRNHHSNWTDVEAHDFPHPEAELELDFSADEIGATPKGWTAAQGNVNRLSVIPDGARRVLRAQATEEPLIGLYSPPWESADFAFATEIRLPEEGQNAVGIVFGFVDPRNHGRVFLDNSTGTIRVVRLVDDQETLVAVHKTDLPAGEWLPLEIELESGELKVDFRDGLLVFTANIGEDTPPSPLGIYVPSHGTVELRDIEMKGSARSPRVSIVRSSAYKNGDPTTDLLKASALGFRGGAGVSLWGSTPSLTARGGQSEYEWPLVVRRFADGGFTNDEGDTFEFRMVADGDDGTSETTGANPVLRLTIPPGHVGGTFVETPGRIGPWKAANGDLYFIMEPAETSNLFMMVKSTDDGRTWREVDGANRPETSDLESVDGRQIGDTIHIVHQVTESTRYHTFRTSDHPTAPETWHVRDELGASADSVAQATTLAVRSDRSVVAFYVGATIHYNVRSASGTWGQETIIDEGVGPKLAGPQAVLGEADVVHLAYYAMDGTVWYRRLLPDGSLTAKEQIASGLGITRADYGSVLPLLFIPEDNAAIIIYRSSDGKLWERRIVNNAPPTPAVRVTDRNVVQQAVDSQQPGADAVLDGKTVRVLFIEDSSRNIFSIDDRGGWRPSTLQVDNINGSWVRGNVYTRRDGTNVHGFIYDAGSEGGAGMNRFAEILLSPQ